MDTWPAPAVVRRGSADPAAPLVVLLHGRGSNEVDIAELAGDLPAGLAYAAVRGPIAQGQDAYAWFANRGIGRPLQDSLARTMRWFRTWLDGELLATDPGRPVVLVGFSGGAAFAGGLLLTEPLRWAGVAVLYGTLPFEAGLATEPGGLAGARVLVAHGEADTVIPADLLARTWGYLPLSGADLTAHRDGGGHGISGEALAVLRAWLDAVPPAVQVSPGESR